MSSSALEKDQDIRDKQAELEESKITVPWLHFLTAETDQFRLSISRSLRPHLAALSQG